MWCVFIILGIVAEVLKANAILVIPTIVEYILFGIGGLLLVLKFIVYCSTKRQMKNTNRRSSTSGNGVLPYETEQFHNQFHGMSPNYASVKRLIL